MTNVNPTPVQGYVHDPVERRQEPAPMIGSAEYPVLPIPFNLVIDGRTYNGVGLSLIGATAKGLPAPNLEGQRRLAVLQFGFQPYSVNLPVEVQIDAASNGTGLIELRFLDPTGPHLASLRYLLNAYVAGDLVDVGGLLGAAVPERKTRPVSGAPRRSFASVTSQVVRGGAILALTVALAAIAARGIYTRYFVHDALGLSHVTAEGTTLRAIASGQIDYVNAAAKSGEPVVSIRAVSGDVVTLSMPCDCTIAPDSAVVGATVLAGDTLMQLIPADARPMVEATFGPAGAQALARGGTAELVMPDGRIAEATAQILPSTPQMETEAINRVRLLPVSTISMADFGQPVTARVKLSPFAWIKGFLPTRLESAK